MCSYCKKHDEDQVPDPYYGGSQGFEKVTSSTNLLFFKKSKVTYSRDFHVLIQSFFTGLFLHITKFLAILALISATYKFNKVM